MSKILFRGGYILLLLLIPLCLPVFASGQFLNRDSYYGAMQSLSSYGNTRDNSYNLGVQYKTIFGNSTLVSGIENTSGFLLDKKLGAGDIIRGRKINFFGPGRSHSHRADNGVELAG